MWAFFVHYYRESITHFQHQRYNGIQFIIMILIALMLMFIYFPTVMYLPLNTGSSSGGSAVG
jgi:hypothetical protein